MSIVDILVGTRGNYLKIVLDLDKVWFSLGESVEADVIFKARRHIKLKDCRVELLMVKNYAEMFMRQVAGRGHAGIIMPAKKDLMVPKQEIVERSETHVQDHSSINFGSSEMKAGESVTQRVGLRMPHQEPPQSLTGSVTWSLVVTADLESNDEFGEPQTISVSKKLSVTGAERDEDALGIAKVYLGYLNPDHTAVGKKRSAAAWTAIVLVSLCLLALGGELYKPLDHLWTLALVLWIGSIGMAIWFGISARREIGSGIMQGVGIGLIALALTWFDLSSLLFFLDYF